jgi:hypothetical protein
VHSRQLRWSQAAIKERVDLVNKVNPDSKQRRGVLSDPFHWRFQLQGDGWEDNSCELDHQRLLLFSVDRGWKACGGMETAAETRVTSHIKRLTQQQQLFYDKNVINPGKKYTVALQSVPVSNAEGARKAANPSQVIKIEKTNGLAGCGAL